MQPELRLRDAGLKYECLNPDCFFCGSLLSFHEVSWKDVWNTFLEDLEPIPICPSCGDPMAHWEDDE